MFACVQWKIVPSQSYTNNMHVRAERERGFLQFWVFGWLKETENTNVFYLNAGKNFLCFQNLFLASCPCCEIGTMPQQALSWSEEGVSDGFSF